MFYIEGAEVGNTKGAELRQTRTLICLERKGGDRSFGMHGLYVLEKKTISETLTGSRSLENIVKNSEIFSVNSGKNVCIRFSSQNQNFELYSKFRGFYSKFIFTGNFGIDLKS